MKRNLVQNLSANTLQLILNQIFGVVIFYILSASLDKNSFGQINLALAILLGVFNILSLGIDQLVIKRIAAGEPVQTTLSLYIFHVLIAGLLFYSILLIGKALFVQAGDSYNLLLLIGIGKLMIFFSTPFKQVASGMERFRLLAYMSVTSNLLRCVCLLACAFFHYISIHSIVVIFIAGDAVELLFCICLFKRSIKTRLPVTWNKLNYINLLRESIPQTGVVLITSALARFDWIFIGLILSAAKLAEYSFAYKIFEMATLPLLAIAPLLIPLFTKQFQQQNINTANLKFLIRSEIIIAALIALVLNICWAPVIDSLTGGKYGTVNIKTIFILSLCMPLLYVNNFLWTIYFARGELKMILTSFVITLFVNVAGDILLIPHYKNEGAAFAFLLSCFAQTVFYLKKNELTGLNIIWQALLICTACALCSGLIAGAFHLNTWITLLLSVLIYTILVLFTGQVQLNDRKNLREVLNW
ncbi:MAG: polysaccharide biosynthesis protein [Mucilaginibacter sp.]|nr:polysaccharide biosynthesis protein [Mucilaginibacter sp.]